MQPSASRHCSRRYLGLMALVSALVTCAWAGGISSGTAVLGTLSVVAQPTVPVVSCPSSYALGAPRGKIGPKQLRLGVAPVLSAHLAFYSDRTRTLPPALAPRGWACSVEVGADGSVSIAVFPKGHQSPPTSGKPGVYDLSLGTCQGCVWGAVCPYIKAAGKELGAVGSCTPAPKGQRATWLRGSPNKVTPPIYDVLSLQLSRAPDEVSGALLYRYAAHLGYASEAYCAVAAADSRWCTAIVGHFIDTRWMI